MEDSILNDVKKFLGLTPEYKAFDSEIIMYINSVILILAQIGVGPTSGFRVFDEHDSWEEYLSENNDPEAVKTYMGMKVKYMFDPPSGSAAMEALKSVCSELEWRINLEVDDFGKDEEVKDE